uniref:Uncharacterized protein n=1 Tax=Ditylum brightwellii TaxID=49249 RepID=A0A6U3NSX8_9STRA|mmetsp:Transcript_11384/g.16969  ORF Transcript_11384/g.16969 Transcript_11384/m.16969 type:complete len:111 (+) Transcript_11384:192-524(+)
MICTGGMHCFEMFQGVCQWFQYTRVQCSHNSNDPASDESLPYPVWLQFEKRRYRSGDDLYFVEYMFWAQECREQNHSRSGAFIICDDLQFGHNYKKPTNPLHSGAFGICD